MNACNHMTLELLPERKKTLRCRHCHLTLADGDLPDGFCPECYETFGVKRSEFDELISTEERAARYRCDNCGAIIASR